MLLWMESFDIYGDTGNEGKMLDGLWAERHPNVVLSTTKVRTGQHSMRFPSGSGIQILRRVFGADKTTVGIGFGLYMNNLPTASNVMGLEFRDGSNNNQCSVLVTTTGALALRRGTTTIATSEPALTAAAWNHIEIEVTIGDSDGACEIRVNEATVLSVTGVDTKGTTSATTAQVAIGGFVTNMGPGTLWYVDDLFTRDTLGDTNTGFIGDRRVYTMMPDADGPEQDWTVSTGTDAFAVVDEIPPNDDTDYISTVAADSVVSLTLNALPETAVQISAVQVMNRTLKTDAGTADLMTSVRSGSSVTDAASRPITTAWTYYFDLFPLDPATGAPWTPASFDEIEVLFERTAA